MSVNNKPFFKNFLTDEDSALVEVSSAMLASMASVPNRFDHNVVEEFISAAQRIYRGEANQNGNSSWFQIKAAEEPGLYRLRVGRDFLLPLAMSLIASPDKAVAKLGYCLRNCAPYKPSSTPGEIRWRGKGYFICGTNVPAKAATLSFNRSTLLTLASMIPALENQELHDLFSDLAEILDDSNQEVNEELDEATAAVDEDLLRIQG